MALGALAPTGLSAPGRHEAIVLSNSASGGDRRVTVQKLRRGETLGRGRGLMRGQANHFSGLASSTGVHARSAWFPPVSRMISGEGSGAGQGTGSSSPIRRSEAHGYRPARLRPSCPRCAYGGGAV